MFDNANKSPGRAWAAGWKRVSMLAAGIAVAGSIGVASAQTLRINFTPQDVSEIGTAIEGSDSTIYLLRLPTFVGDRIVGQRVVGNLPVKEVEKLAASLHVKLDPNANIIAVFDPDDNTCQGGSDQGGASTQGGAGTQGGNGPGSMTQTRASGFELSEKLEVVLENIEASRYQFLR
jgi:hypothetical protein